MNTPNNIGEQKHRKRTRQYYVIILLSALVGFPFGMILGRLSKGALDIDGGVLAVVLVFLCIAFVYLTWLWYRNMDEFEQSAFHKSGNIAFHTGFIALPWFILSKQGLLPQLDAAYLMAGMSVVFCITLIAKKGSL